MILQRFMLQYNGYPVNESIKLIPHILFCHKSLYYAEYF